MSKETKINSLFEAISDSELTALSGGGNTKATGGEGGSVGHTIKKGDVKDGSYRAGDGGDAITISK